MTLLESSGSGASTKSVTPLYKRLPSGPHRLDHKQVLHHQRIRIHGAMIEAVAVNGYEATSVKLVVGLAGVSRRSFYEQFANKEACFLATFDLIAARGLTRVNEAYRLANGEMEDRMRAAFGEFAEAINENTKSAGLAIVEAQTAGAAASLRLRRATAMLEQMLANSFSRAPGAIPMPIPMIRGIVGGLHEATAKRLREGGTSEVRAQTEQMLAWALLFQTPATTRVAARLGERMRELPTTNGSRRSPVIAGCADDRERLLQSVLRLAVAEDYQELSAPRIAEEANVPIEAFFELYRDKNECFLAAFEMLGNELLIATDSDLRASDWPRALRRAIGDLMWYLADHPLYAQVIAAQAYTAGPEAIARNRALAHQVAVQLLDGAPKRRRGSSMVEGVMGAIWHTIRCQVASGKIQHLPALSDYLSYVLLAPFIGVEAAAEVVTGEPSEPAAARATTRKRAAA